MINFYDIETFNDNGKVVPYCICLVLNNNTKYELYYNDNSNIIIDFLNTIIYNIDENIEIFSHNINFDGMVILEELSKKKIHFTSYIRDLNIYWIEIRYMTFNIKIRCSYKIIPISIKKLGIMINNKKEVFPYKFVNYKTLFYIGPQPSIDFYEKDDYIDNINFLNSNKNDLFNVKKKTIEYCMQDILIIKEVFENIHKILISYSKNIFINSFSFSSISYKIFKKKFDCFKICEISLKINEYSYIKSSYFGGRCEIFGNSYKCDIIHHFDYSGMYAQCMRYKYPIGKGVFKYNNLDINDIGFHSVKVSSKMDIPILPIHYNKKLIFPNGIFNGVYDNYQLKYFIENGGKIIKHYSSYIFDDEGYVFEKFENEFTEIRKKGLYYKIFGKSMNNGLYGSFALNEEPGITIIIFSEEEFNNYLKLTDVITWKKLNECYILNIRKNNLSKKYLDKKNRWKEETERNLTYSSFISSYARIKLHKGFMEVIKNKGRVLYCDTDSIFASFKNNNHMREMGEIKWTDIYKDAVFISPKFYFLKNNDNSSILKSKGVKNYIYDFNEIKKKFYNNEDKILFTNQLNFSKKEYSLKQKYINKILSLNSYNKRIFIKNKKETIALDINPD